MFIIQLGFSNTYWYIRRYSILSIGLNARGVADSDATAVGEAYGFELGAGDDIG